MAPATIPTCEPTRAVAGDTWRWDRAVCGYTPAEGWALHYAFRGVGELDVDAAANGAGTGWEVTVAAALTAPLGAGVYRWLAFVTRGDERYTVDRGRLTVLADLAEAEPGDEQGDAEALLPIVEAEIRARITGTGSAHDSYTIGTRSITKIPLSELRQLRRELKAEVSQRKGGGRLKPVGAIFARPR